MSTLAMDLGIIKQPGRDHVPQNALKRRAQFSLLASAKNIQEKHNDAAKIGFDPVQGMMQAQNMHQGRPP